MRKKTKEEWTEKHRNCCEEVISGRRLGAEKSLPTLVGRMKVSAKPATRRKALKSTGSTTAQDGTRSEGRSQRLSGSGNKKREPQRKSEWKWQRGIVEHPLSESQWNRVTSGWKSGSRRSDKSWGIPAEGFKGHVATDGSLLGTAGKWGACGWSVVQLDYDEELGPLCMGCTARWRQNLRSSAPSRRRS